tara:strand:+ start:640 stop:915 length:276 start_codon:yes stop_codon:yes gene_type:complete
VTSKDRDTKNYWLDNKKNVDKIWYSLVGICVISVLADFFYHKHVSHPVEDLIVGMHGWYSFIVCVFLVLCAKLLRKILMRSEDYYDEINDD